MKRSAIIGFGMSTFIEFAQYFIMRNTAVDDIILNTLGAICGYWVYRLLRKMFPGFSRKFICNITQAAGNWWLCRWKGPFDLNVIMWYQPLYPNKEKCCISPPREDNVHLLNRGGVQYDPTRTSHSIGGLRQRKNKDRSRSSCFYTCGGGQIQHHNWLKGTPIGRLPGGCSLYNTGAVTNLWHFPRTFAGEFQCSSWYATDKVETQPKILQKGA